MTRRRRISWRLAAVSLAAALLAPVLLSSPALAQCDPANADHDDNYRVTNLRVTQRNFDFGQQWWRIYAEWDTPVCSTQAQGVHGLGMRLWRVGRTDGGGAFTSGATVTGTTGNVFWASRGWETVEAEFELYTQKTGDAGRVGVRVRVNIGPATAPTITTASIPNISGGVSEVVEWTHSDANLTLPDGYLVWRVYESTNVVELAGEVGADAGTDMDGTTEWRFSEQVSADEWPQGSTGFRYRVQPYNDFSGTRYVGHASDASDVLTVDGTGAAVPDGPVCDLDDDLRTTTFTRTYSGFSAPAHTWTIELSGPCDLIPGKPARRGSSEIISTKDDYPAGSFRNENDSLNHTIPNLPTSVFPSITPSPAVSYRYVVTRQPPLGVDFIDADPVTVDIGQVGQVSNFRGRVEYLAEGVSTTFTGRTARITVSWDPPENIETSPVNRYILSVCREEGEQCRYAYGSRRRAQEIHGLGAEETGSLQMDDYLVGIPLYEDEERPSATYTIDLDEEGAYTTYRHAVYARSHFGGSSFDGRITAQVTRNPGTGFALPVVAGNPVGRVETVCGPREPSATDPNADCALDANDALIYYYAYALRDSLGNGR